MTTSATERQEEQREAEEIRSLVRASHSKYLEQIEANAIAQRQEALQFRALLARQGPSWIADAKPHQVMAFCRVAAALHLNPLVGEVYFLWGAVYVGIAGRRKLASRVRTLDGKPAMRGESASRLLTPDECEVHGVHDGDIARIVEVWRNGWVAPAQGVGIVRHGEVQAAQIKQGKNGLAFSPLGRNPEMMAAKRAAAAAYRIAFPDLDVQVLDYTETPSGYEVDVLDGPRVGEPAEADGAPDAGVGGEHGSAEEASQLGADSSQQEVLPW